MTISPYFQPHVRFQPKEFLPGLVSRHPTVSLGNDWLERTREGDWSNRQSMTTQTGKQQLFYTAAVLARWYLYNLRAQNIDIHWDCNDGLGQWGGSTDRKAESAFLAQGLCVWVKKDVKVLLLSLFDTRVALAQYFKRPAGLKYHHPSWLLVHHWFHLCWTHIVATLH